MGRFSLLVFDLDGTLVDSFPGITIGLNRTLEAFGRPPVDLEWVRRHVGRGARRLVSAACGPSIEPEVFLTAFRSNYQELLLDHSPPFDGVDETLRTLSAQYTLAVASNKPTPWVEAVVRRHGWSELTAVVAGPETVDAHKPDPAMLRHIMDRTGRTPPETLMVGDMPVDVECARAAGVTMLGVTSGAADETTLREAGCEQIVTCVTELPSWLENNQATNS